MYGDQNATLHYVHVGRGGYPTQPFQTPVTWVTTGLTAHVRSPNTRR